MPIRPIHIIKDSGKVTHCAICKSNTDQCVYQHSSYLQSIFITTHRQVALKVKLTLNHTNIVHIIGA
jgi:hypothetical protein